MASRILSLPTTHNSNKFNNTNVTTTTTASNNSNSLMLSSISSNSSTYSSGSNNNYSMADDVAATTKSFLTGLANINTSSTVAVNSVKWNIGLMNSEGKYLTAENFGFKINATGNTLRKKQKWQIEQDNDEHVHLISPLGYYLSTDKYGKLSCEKSSADNDCKFYLETNSEGKWSFKSVAYNYYFGGTGDRLHCFSKLPELWTIHLAIHPQV